LRWASVCNNVGATSGSLIGNSLFLVLESKSFCNAYIRPYFGLSPKDHGMTNLKGKSDSPLPRFRFSFLINDISKDFMTLFGVIFIVSTTLVMIFKKENSQNTLNDSFYTENELSFKSTVSSLFKILEYRNIQRLLIVLFTYKVIIQ